MAVVFEIGFFIKLVEPQQPSSSHPQLAGTVPLMISSYSEILFSYHMEEKGL